MSLSLTHRRLLALRAVPGFGLKSFHQLYEYFGSLSALFEADQDALQASGCKPEMANLLIKCLHHDDCPTRVIDTHHAWLAAADGNALLHIEEPQFPSLLREIHCPPPLLYVAGNASVLNKPCIALIGARKASPLALAQAHDIAAELSLAGWNIVSGMALGIDAAAHEGALTVSQITTAVMATGIDRCYPRRHAGLAARICEQGAVISEMPLGTAPHAGLFPRRNRLVSGLSHGVLVVEAGMKSGSLITASLALEQNRELMAMPGAITNPQVKGCHWLLRQGAALVESASDVMDIVGRPQEGAATFEASTHEQQVLSQDELLILRVLADSSALDFDALVRAIEVPVAQLQSCLLDLELAGWVKALPGGYQLAKSVHFSA